MPSSWDDLELFWLVCHHRPSGMGDFRLYGRPVSQTISSLSVRSNCVKILLLTKHILHVVLQCLSFTVAWVQSSLWSIYASYEVFFPARVGKGLVVFLIVSIHWLWLLSSLLSVEWYDSSIPIVSASLAAFIPSAEIITLVSRVVKFALSSPKGLLTHSNDPMASLIPEKFLGCWIPSMILVRTGLGCQMFALKCIQHVDSFRP